MMDLDEAIQHCKEQVQEQAKKGCYSCAEEHQQLAEWLKDYKRLLEQEPKLRQALELEKGAYNALVKNIQCADCISRQAAIRAIEALQLPIMREASTCYQYKFSGMSEAKEAVENLPSVTPQQRTGRWEEYYTFLDPVTPRYRCSICQEPMEKILDGNQLVEWWSDYCPHCGAKMEVEE